MSKKLPNIILIVCDTLGAKHMSLYGYHRKTTPMLEMMVEEGNFTVYTRCFSPAPWTTPSHASLFTGLYPTQHNTHGADLEYFYLPSNLFSLPEILKGLGYKTVGFSNNNMITKEFGFSRGFDEFIELDKSCPVKNELQVPPLNNNYEKIISLLRKLQNKEHRKLAINRVVNALYRRTFGKSVTRYSVPYTIKTSKLFLGSLKKMKDIDNPFFIFINIMETHDRYIPPKNYRNKFINYGKRWIKKQPDWRLFYKTPFSIEVLETLNGLYDEEVLFLDSILYEMYISLKKLKLFDNTLFIITSDHGEAIGEHQHFGHMFSVYNEVLHVPLIIHYPGNVNNRENSNIVQTHDIYATIFEIIGAYYPSPFSSISLLSSIKRNFAVSELVKPEIYIRQLNVHDYHQVVYINKDLKKLIVRSDKTSELYDLDKDFFENKPLDDKEIKKEIIVNFANIYENLELKIYKKTIFDF